MKNVFKTHALLLGLAMSCFGFTAAQAAVKTYVGSYNGVWTDSANWSPAGVPTLSDDVTIASSTSFVYVDVPVNTNISFSTLTIGVGGAIEFKGGFEDVGTLILDGGEFIQENDVQHWLSGDLIIKANGKLRSTGLTFDEAPTTSVNLIAQNIDIQVDGLVDASGAGHYQVDNPGPGVGGNSSVGPGGGANCGAGGAGSVGAGGVPYSSVFNPFSVSRGSAGGATGANGNYSEGGGLIKLVAMNLFTINGKIKADGLSGGSDKGGGAGGAISLVAGEYAGAPQEISAHGGNGIGNGGGGGGGCVRGAYFNSAGTINFNLAGGLVDVAGGTGFNPGSTGQTVTAFVIPAPLKFEIFPGSKTTTTLDLTWMWGGGFFEDHFLLEKSTDGTTYASVVSIPTSTFGFGYELTGLTPVSKYFLRVSSVSSTYAITSSDFAYLRAFTYPRDAEAPSISSFGQNSAALSIGLNANPGSSNYLRVLLGSTSTLGTVYYGTNGMSVGNTPTYFMYPNWSGTVYGLVPSTTYSFFNVLSTYNDEVGSYLSSATGTLATTTPLATPTTPTISLVSTSTIALTWTQNNNPATTPYAV